MQDEAAVGLNGATIMHGLRGVTRALLGDGHLIQDIAHGQVDGTINNYTQGTVVIVLTDQSDGLRKIGVAHRRHGDKEMIVQKRHSGVHLCRSIGQPAARFKGP